MSGIPLHLQRKFEQRWAAKFVPPAVSASSRKPFPEKHGLKPCDQFHGRRLAPVGAKYHLPIRGRHRGERVQFGALKL
jgi:hypothetical protein